MDVEDLGHGPRLSGAEYDRLIVALHEDLPEVPSREQDRLTRQKELHLTIDYRLGKNFPAKQREALWNVQERVERKRGRLLWKYLVRKLIGGSINREAQGLAGFLVDEYAKVLNQAELECYLGEEEVGRPGLPIDGVRDGDR